MTERNVSEETVRAGLSESEMRDNVLRLVFGGDPRRYEQASDHLPVVADLEVD